MSRAHCVACGTSVVVDPQGTCPEGHHVGSRGARVETAMGSQTAYPDEPEPWVYMIEELVGASAGAGGGGDAPPRELRPLRMRGLPDGGFDDVPTDSDALLRELHSLAALDEATPPPAPARDEATPPAAAPQAPTPPAPPTQPAARPPRLDRDAMTDAFAELSALDAFAREQDGAQQAVSGSGTRGNGARPGTTRTGGETNGSRPGTARSEPASTEPATGDGPQHDPEELAALFSTELSSAPPPPPAPPSGSDTAPTDDRAAALAASAGQLDELFDAAVSAPTLRPRGRAGATEADDTQVSGDEPVEAADRQTAAEAAGEAPAPATGSERPATDGGAGAAAPAAPAPPPPPLDLSTFTAKGGTGRKGGRKRRFGR